jgi:hypothetical protein
MMNYVNAGHVERIGDGRFSLTVSGLAHFKIGAPRSAASQSTQTPSSAPATEGGEHSWTPSDWSSDDPFGENNGGGFGGSDDDNVEF